MKLLFSILISLLCLNAAVRADSADVEPSRQAEQFVLAHVVAGEVADLSELPEPDRVLSSEFLYNLVTNSNKDLKVHPHGVAIAHAIFPEGIDLVNADVPFNVELSECQFLEDVELSQSHFRKNLILSGSRFNAILNFNDATVDGNLEMSKVDFHNPEGEADLTALQVGGYFDLHAASFAGKAAFIRDQINANIDAQGTRFTNPHEEISFDSMVVDGYAYFQESVFSSSALFDYAEIGKNFGAAGARFESSDTDARVSFNSMKVGRNAFFNGTVFNSNVDFGHADVSGKFELIKSQFNARYSSTNFTGMKVDVADFTLTRFANEYLIDAMSYRELKVVAEPTKRVAVSPTEFAVTSPTEFVSHARFSPQAYASLEEFLKRQGMEGSANVVYIEQKRRERKGLGFFSWIGSFALDVLVGYGRRPWLAFIWSAIWIVFGWFVFRRRDQMEAQKTEHEDRTYSPFWYTLDLFLPFVDLQAAGIWAPRKERRFARNYASVHALLGWMLIPIGLAAVSGLIR